MEFAASAVKKKKKKVAASQECRDESSIPVL